MGTEIREVYIGPANKVKPKITSLKLWPEDLHRLKRLVDERLYDSRSEALREGLKRLYQEEFKIGNA